MAVALQKIVGAGPLKECTDPAERALVSKFNRRLHVLTRKVYIFALHLNKSTLHSNSIVIICLRQSYIGWLSESHV